MTSRIESCAARSIRPDLVPVVPNIRYCARMSVICCIEEVSRYIWGEHGRDIGT
jgi:hypothetical protein